MISRETCPTEWMKRRVAYYETWADSRDCDKFKPEEIPAHAFTHLNIAFGTIKSDHTLAVMDESMIRRITNLRLRNPALEFYLSVGGWDFNDPGPTRTSFSDMAATSDTRTTFVNSVMDILEKYGLNGIDIGMFDLKRRLTSVDTFW